ncbi:60S ribosomal protein L7-2 [Acorus calamus]|uniref:60S ribosomal protein L7-2 n=1 Tax=Acorus calamus TaxID=4465 RepID=A0AAV9CD82_ACOCL|nr:60S ribosomal protein L7-2 [Acorus calamus]
METAKVIPGSVLKKRKRSEEWSLVKKAAETAKKKRSTDRRLIFKRAEHSSIWLFECATVSSVIL